MNNELVSEEQLSNFMNLIERKNIDLHAIKEYLIENNLNMDLSKLSLVEFNTLFKLINTPDIKVGDKVNFIPEYRTYKRSKTGVVGEVTNVTKSERTIGFVIEVIKGNVHRKYPEPWIRQGTPFVIKKPMLLVKEKKV